MCLKEGKLFKIGFTQDSGKLRVEFARGGKRAVSGLAIMHRSSRGHLRWSGRVGSHVCFRGEG